MAKIIEIENIKNPRWSGSEFIAQLTKECQMFLFSYSPAFNCLSSWSDNAKLVLGMDDTELALHVNVFMRHVTDDDRFRVLNELEDALKGDSIFNCQYFWHRPDNNKKIQLLARGKLFKNAYNSRDDLFEGFIVNLNL